MKKGISEYSVGDTFVGFMLVKEANKRVATNEKPFLTLKLADKTGEIDTIIWNVSEEQVERYTSKEIVEVKGTVSEYRGKTQLNLLNLRLKEDSDNVELSDLLETAHISQDVMLKEVTSTIDEIKNEKIKGITETLFKKHKEDYSVFPAASKNHHAYVSGLLHHVYGMLKLAKELCRIYPSLNKDLLFAGVILHDLSKVKEYTGAVATERTIEGQLKGHISMVNEEIGIVANELNIEGEEILLLQHMVLSHHHKGEWGSPVSPIIKEAEVLHFIDNLDAKMNMLDRALEKVEPGGFTERLFAMDNRSFYKPESEDLN